MQVLMNFNFTNPRGEKITDWVFFNRDRPRSWISMSPWIGSLPTGDTEQVNQYSSGGLYMMEGRAIIALVRGTAVDDIMINVGDTGTGRLFRGLTPYTRPIEFTWDCVPVPGAQASRPSPPSAPDDDAIYIPPFTRP